MMYSGEGIVLKRKILREDDLIVTILSKEYGKISLAVRSGSKIKSKLSPALAGMYRIEFTAVKGQEIDTLTFSAIIERCGAIEPSLDQRLRAFQIAEIVDSLVQERVADDRIYEHTLEALRALYGAADPVRTGAFLVHRFLWVLLQRLGTGPEVRFCVNCQKTEKLLAFSAARGGLLCQECCRLDPGAVKLPQHMLAILSPVKISLESVNTRDARLFFQIVVEWAKTHLSRPLRSFSFASYVPR